MKKQLALTVAAVVLGTLALTGCAKDKKLAEINKQQQSTIQGLNSEIQRLNQEIDRMSADKAQPSSGGASSMSSAAGSSRYIK